ncbi:MAG TPA: PepSY domain-containing protein [Nitrososphaeraceae archaeon]|jgi:uncharacterized membrane protein YkoI
MNIKGISSKKGLTIYAILGAGILLSAIFIASPVASTWAQQLAGNNSNNNNNNNNNNAYMNQVSTIPKINGSVNVVENIKNMFKENAKVSFTAASETAQKQISNGTILGGHLGVTQGYLTYTYFVVDPSKQTGYRVIIDAGNGKVLYTSQGLPIGPFNHQQGQRMFGPFGAGGFGHWNNPHGPFGAGARAGGFWH